MTSGELEDCDVFLSYARVVRQPADNSCLYHALSYCLAAEDLLENVYDHHGGYKLRSSLNTYIRNNDNVEIKLAPDVRATITEAVNQEGYSCLAYSQFMSNKNEWGGVIEIGTVAETYTINIFIFVPVKNSRLFKLLGKFRCIDNNAATSDIHILYTGLNYYDSLTNVVFRENNAPPVENLENGNHVASATYDVRPSLAERIQQFDENYKDQSITKRESLPSRKKKYTMLEDLKALEAK